jgi:hypothetical protein
MGFVRDSYGATEADMVISSQFTRPIPPSAQTGDKFPRPVDDPCDNPANVHSFVSSSTVLLGESVLGYVGENGRTYYAFNEGSRSRYVSVHSIQLFTDGI